MLAIKMAVSLALGCFLLFNSFYALPARAAVIEDLQQVASVLAPDTYQELTARVNNYTRIYRVEEGDTIERIARRFQTDPELVAVMNYLESGTILRPGQFLVLPYEKDESYTVAAGDTLWGISRRFGVSVSRLAAANGIVDARRLQIGTLLTIPGSPAVAATRPETVPVSRNLKPGSFIWPLIGTITSGFGWRDNEFHHGLDIAGEIGDKIRAALSGEVVFSGWFNDIYGRIIKLDHGNGLETIYAHNNRNLVSVGDYVQGGETIAELGNTGKTTGPHLHFEVHENGKAVNPERFLSR